MAMDNKTCYVVKSFLKKDCDSLEHLLVCFFIFTGSLFYIGSILFDVQASQNNINVIDTYVAFSRHSSLKR